MKTLATIDFLRSRFSKLNDYYGAKGFNPQLSIIRIEKELVNGQGVYVFDIKKENLSPTENNLKRNDLFSCVGIGVFLSVAEPNKPGVASLLTYAKKGVAAAAGVTPVKGFNTHDINALYNGFFHVKTATTTNINDMPAGLFKNVPLIDGAAYGENLPDAFNLLDSLHILPEELVLAGTQDHLIEVRFPTFAAADYSTLPAGSTGKIVFAAVGYRVPSGTSEQFKNDESNPYRLAI